jgi:hypothetical protein
VKTNYVVVGEADSGSHENKGAIMSIHPAALRELAKKWRGSYGMSENAARSAANACADQLVEALLDAKADTYEADESPNERAFRRMKEGKWNLFGPDSALVERTAQVIAHRAVGNEEHDGLSKISGCCAVCLTPWPCEYAGEPPDVSGRAEAIAERVYAWYAQQGSWPSAASVRDKVREFLGVDDPEHDPSVGEQLSRESDNSR